MKIKGIIPITLTLVCLLIIVGCNKGQDTSVKTSPPSWKVTSEIKTAFISNSSNFLNKNVGITVGAGGETHFTQDGGKTWGNGNNSSLCLFGVSMINDKLAWATGNGAYVVKSVNGGYAWQHVHDFGEYEPNHPRYINFVDANTGWIATPREFNLNGKNTKLGYTKDGGETWEPVELPKDAGHVAAISLRTQNDGYVLDDEGNLYITGDGGKSFSKQSMDLKDIDYFLTDAPNIALKFFDAKNALICYYNQEGKLQAARSGDGGMTWVKEKMPEIYRSSLSLSPDGKILTSTSGGALKILSYN